MNTRILFAMLLVSTMLFSTVEARDFRIVTFADGRPDGGIRQSADTEDGIDAPGDIFVFDQKLLAEDGETIIGRNAGFCIRTDPGSSSDNGNDHPDLPDNPDNNYGQCTWTLSFLENSKYRGSIVVSGREADLGTSVLPIVGGTGDFLGAVGVLSSTPIPQNEGGVLFHQELIFKRPLKKTRWRKESKERDQISP